MAKIRATLKNVPLWPHQEKGVALIRRFMAGEQNGAALINMPTGTGKTGVIAVASQLLRNLDNILIIAPRLMLREQLAREVGGRFFTKVGVDPSTLPKQIVELKKSSDLDSIGEPTKTIFLSTFQLLDTINRTGTSALSTLSRKVDLVIVDEGHYEPAPSWRAALACIEKPTVVFTATPYRNDLKIFNVDENYVQTYSLTAALKDLVVRPVNWYQRDTVSTPAEFVEDLMTFLAEEDLENDEQTRVIIRAESPASIRQIADELVLRGKSCVGIHETFSNSGEFSYEKKSVPDPSLEPARFWIHQFKLLEGFDDPSFRVLALYDSLSNGRRLVQQVGRILRNPNRSRTSRAYALDHSSGVQEELWRNFISFDEMLDEQGLGAISLNENLAKALQEAQPRVVYTDGRFRPRFHPTAEGAESDLKLQLAVNVFRKERLGSLKKVTDLVKHQFMEEDRPHRLTKIDRNTNLLIYVSFRNSPLLRDSYFFESRLGVAIIHVRGSYVFFHDSAGGIPQIPSFVASRLSSAELRHLFSNASSLSSVSLKNSDVGRNAIRRRTVSALSLTDIPPAFDDHGFICSTATGYGGSHGRRYVGFDRGRVSDLSRARTTVSEFLDWLGELSASLSSRSKQTAMLDRFAEVASVPDNPEPSNILFDLSDLTDNLVTTTAAKKGPGIPIDIPDQCMNISAGKFEIVANGEICEASIMFGAGRYQIKSAALDRLYSSTSEVAQRGIVAHLNYTQSFRVIPKSSGSFYTLGEFFEPAIRFGPQFSARQTGLFSIIETHGLLENVSSEKGIDYAFDGSGWDPDSLFGIIDDCAAGTTMQQRIGTPDIVVCDDMATESADFILADCGADKRVVFLHAKAIPNTSNAKKYGASALQDVCGQATKNLGYLKRFSTDRPSKCRNWYTATWSNGKVHDRVRRNTSAARTGLGLWKEISTVITDPFSDLEVWLLLGRLLSKKALLREVSKSNPSPEAQQAVYLLQSTMTVVASIGGRLRVLCSP